MDWFYDGQSWVYADKQPERNHPQKNKLKQQKRFSTHMLEKRALYKKH